MQHAACFGHLPEPAVKGGELLIGLHLVALGSGGQPLQAPPRGQVGLQEVICEPLEFKVGGPAGGVVTQDAELSVAEVHGAGDGLAGSSENSAACSATAPRAIPPGLMSVTWRRSA